MIKKANKKVAVLNFVILFILIVVGLFVLSVPQFDLSSLSVASFYLYFPSVALLLVYCILYLSFALTKKEHSALEKILNVYTALMIATIAIAVCASLIVTFCGKNGKAEKERFLNTFGTQALFGLDSADAHLSVKRTKENEHNTRNFVFGNTYITDQNRSFVFRGEQNNDGGDFTLINIAGSGILNVPKPICELLYSFHLLNTFDLTDTKVEQINDDVQGCARIIDSSDGFNYGSFLFFNGKSIVYLNIQYSDSLSLDKDYVTEQCVRYLENTK